MEFSRNPEVTGPVFRIDTCTPVPRSSTRMVFVSPSIACFVAT
jgi:hypothetical protein